MFVFLGNLFLKFCPLLKYDLVIVSLFLSSHIGQRHMLMSFVTRGTVEETSSRCRYIRYELF